jgi:Lsr2
MAQRTMVQLYDDLDNTPIPKGEGETVTFELDRTEYEIDLSRNNAAKLRDELAPFVGAARKIGGGNGRRRRSGVRAAPRNAEQLKALREWAKKQGMKVADRGRISADVERAYHAAH